MLSTYKCHLSSCGDLLGIFGVLQNFELKLAMDWSWHNYELTYVIKDSHMIWIAMEKLMSVCTWQWESLAANIHCWQVYQWQFENRLIDMNFEGSKLSYVQFSHDWDQCHKLYMIVDIYKFRSQWELKIYILMPTTSLEHPSMCKSENQLYWYISILSVMGKSEMWGHLHSSLHKLQTKTIATYCYQQRLFRILRFIDREQPCTMDTYGRLCTQIYDKYVQQQLGDICWNFSFRKLKGKILWVKSNSDLELHKVEKIWDDYDWWWNFILGPKIKQIDGR
jgi:hypothetical protein